LLLFLLLIASIVQEGADQCQSEDGECLKEEEEENYPWKNGLLWEMEDHYFELSRNPRRTQ
jgi:hypothetical protein